MENVIIACSDFFVLEVLMIIEKNNEKKLPYADQYEPIGYITIGSEPILKEFTKLKWLGAIDNFEDKGVSIIVAIPEPLQKEYAVNLLRSKGSHFANLRAYWVLAPLDYKMGEGSIIAAQSVKKEAILGDFVILYNAMVGAGTIGDFSTVLGYSNVTNAHIGTSTYIGNNALILEKITIGAHVRIQSGSVVVRKVKDNLTVSGIPATIVRS